MSELADTADAALAALRRIAAQQHVSTLTAAQYRRYRSETDYPAAATIIRQFGTWEHALRSAGLVLPDPAPTSRGRARARRGDQSAQEVIIAALQRIAKKLDAPTISTNQYIRYAKESDPAVITVIRRFGGWNHACEAAGLSANPYQKVGESRIDDTTALEAVYRAGQAYQEATGMRPDQLTQVFYNEWRRGDSDRSTYGTSVLGRRFGAWAEVKSRAGLGL